MNGIGGWGSSDPAVENKRTSAAVEETSDPTAEIDRTNGRPLHGTPAGAAVTEPASNTAHQPQMDVDGSSTGKVSSTSRTISSGSLALRSGSRQVLGSSASSSWSLPVSRPLTLCSSSTPTSSRTGAGDPAGNRRGLNVPRLTGPRGSSCLAQRPGPMVWSLAGCPYFRKCGFASRAWHCGGGRWCCHWQGAHYFRKCGSKGIDFEFQVISGCWVIGFVFRATSFFKVVGFVFWVTSGSKAFDSVFQFDSYIFTHRGH